MLEEDRLSLCFLALSDATRRSMLSRLVEGPLTIGDLGALYPVSLPAISKHIQVLERAGLVSVDKSGRQKYVRLLFEQFALIEIWINGLGSGDDFFDRFEKEIADLL